MKVGLLLVMLISILSQAYTLPSHRDDLALPPFQIQKFSDPAHLAKRQDPIATLYWDRNGNIKAIFNIEISFIFAQIVGHEGTNLARGVVTALQNFVTTAAGHGAVILNGAVWGSQMGTNLPAIIQLLGSGQVTVGVLVTLRPRVRSYQNTVLILQLMQLWFQLSGYVAFQQEVEDAVRVGNAAENRIERRSLIERQTVEAPRYSKFCKLTIQNWQFVLTPGKPDTLLAPLITC